jgi:hypothetical protein
MVIVLLVLMLKRYRLRRLRGTHGAGVLER